MRHFTASTALARAAIACGIAGAAITAAPALASTANPSGGRVVIVTCAGKGVTRPHAYQLFCGDSGALLTKLTWSSWGVPAKGSGKEKINTCDPTCAKGKIKIYPVKVKLSRPKPWPRHSGERYFSMMTVRYTKAVPKGYQRTLVVFLSP